MYKNFCSDKCPDGENVEHFNILEGTGDEVGIFDSLTKTEMQKIIKFMVEESGLDIQMDNPVQSDNSIYMIEALPPPKAEALTFLDEGGPKPQRFAKVIVFRY